MRVYAYDANCPDAESAIRKLASQPLKPGMFIRMTSEEFDALQDRVLAIEVDDPKLLPTPKGEADERRDPTVTYPDSQS